MYLNSILLTLADRYEAVIGPVLRSPLSSKKSSHISQITFDSWGRVLEIAPPGPSIAVA